MTTENGSGRPQNDRTLGSTAASNSGMRFTLVLAILVALFVPPASSQHTHTDMSSPAKLVVRDVGANRLILRLGPMALPAGVSHNAMVDVAPQIFTVPFDGWVTAYHPRMTDAGGSPLPGKLLHHVAFWNLGRSDFLCPEHNEHIFGAGGEMTDWPAIPGVGYRVNAGDRIKITSMFHNPTATNYPDAYLEVELEYATVKSGVALRDVFPAWFDVKGCGESSYDLAPGRNLTTGEFTLSYSGVLLGVGGHLHDYGRQLKLTDITHHQEIAKLDSELDARGHLLTVPIVTFGANGYHLNKGDVIAVAATYENSTGNTLGAAAMGIVVGYFLPEKTVDMSVLRRHQ
jgi:hypothetical protein